MDGAEILKATFLVLGQGTFWLGLGAGAVLGFLFAGKLQPIR